MSLTSLRVALHKHRLWLAPAVLGLILFMTGFQLGKITSPYYASHPLIFNDVNQEGSGEELATLQEQGHEQRVAGEQISTNSPSPASSLIPTRPSSEVSSKKFVGSVNSNLFHDPTCSAANRIKEENQIWFSSLEEAGAAGYSPSQCTREKLGL
jgi:hypothetical protein